MIKEIYLAGGCFWGVEGYFAQLNGVIETKVGYSNGLTEDTNYKLIKSTDHAEVIYLKYNDEILPLTDVLRHYFRIIDPTSINKQGGDVGRQYRTGIYYVDEETADIARQFINELQKKIDKKIVEKTAPGKILIALSRKLGPNIYKNTNTINVNNIGKL